MARARRWDITCAFTRGVVYFGAVAERAGWPLEIRPSGDYGRDARYLKNRARGRGGLQKAVFGQPGARPRGRPADPLYQVFNYEFVSHLLEAIPAHELSHHLEMALTAFLWRYGHVRSGRRKGAVDYDALTVAEAALTLTPQIDAARPWRAGSTAVRLYHTFLEGLRGRPRRSGAA